MLFWFRIAMAPAPPAERQDSHADDYRHPPTDSSHGRFLTRPAEATIRPSTNDAYTEKHGETTDPYHHGDVLSGVSVGGDNRRP